MADSFILLENGDFLVQEDGTSKILLEDGAAPTGNAPWSLVAFDIFVAGSDVVQFYEPGPDQIEVS